MQEPSCFGVDYENDSWSVVFVLKDVMVLLRPYQYVKNLLIFFPLFFSLKMFEPGLFIRACIAFCAFCLVASSVYILNDWMDRFADAGHPEKCFRPIASGRIKSTLAFFVFSIFLLLGLVTALQLSLTVFALMVGYLVLNVAYSFKLKHLPIIDIFLISVFFVMRLFVGAGATGVVLSTWIMLMTFLLALFLSLAKRRDDVLVYVKTNHKARKVVDGYSLRFLEAAMFVSAAIVVVTYVLWSVSPEVIINYSNSNVYMTSVFVVLGILRYMQISFVEGDGGCLTSVFLKDSYLKITLLGWIGSFAWLLYLKNFENFYKF